MGEVLAEQMGIENVEMLGLAIPPEQDQMLVASVKGNVHGAGALAYEDFMDKASDSVGVRLSIDKALSESPRDFEEFLRLIQKQDYEIKRGKHPAVRCKGGKRFIRFRSLG
ncbi:hypothetical protein SAMN04487928_106132 [Butyrivibrio proteoclasticus]|uniref:Uncharacterized protein n=1 Tax=Butyrivibrio proteoclasticus TaxID=43305 RepID=A0A1I5SLW2_9FIRM|nr:hypothetical protein [Butyrivibrio proteoclasticus]SFP71487.1 hypothetical protein SAMN04487928_106132 [Butyrivibrio proteoclasticus]